MDKPAYKVTILFDTSKGKISTEILEDLKMIMNQYDLDVASVTLSTNDELVETKRSVVGAPQPTTTKDKKTHDAQVLRFPVERCEPPKNSNSV